MLTFDKLVKGATKVKVAAPKPKYIEPLLLSTSSTRYEEFIEIMQAIGLRIKDPAWSVVYKAYIVLHIMVREGETGLVLKYLTEHPKYLKPTAIVQSANHNLGFGSGLNSDAAFVIRYAKYLECRAVEFDGPQIDYVRNGRMSNSFTSKKQDGGRLRSLTVDKGLLKEVESVIAQIASLVGCKFTEGEVNNDVILTAFRMLVNDLLALYQALNEGVINILEHFFEMRFFDAERAFKIYVKFVALTEKVVAYLRVAKHLEYYTKSHVPTIKHAPTALTSSLEEYLKDVNFETNRQQYLAEKGKKEGVTEPKVQEKAQPQSQVQSQVPSQTQIPSQALTQSQIPAAAQITQQTVTVPNPWGGLSLTPQVATFTPYEQGQTPSVANLQPLSAEVLSYTGQPFVFAQKTSLPTGAGFGTQPQPQQNQMFAGQPQAFASQPTQALNAQPQAFTGQPAFNSQSLAFTGQPLAFVQNQAFTHQPSEVFSQTAFTGNFTGVQPSTVFSQQPASFSNSFTGQPLKTASTFTGTPQQSVEPLKPIATGTNNPFSRDNTVVSATIMSVNRAQSNPFSSKRSSSSSVLPAVGENSVANLMGRPLSLQQTGTNPFMAKSVTGGPSLGMSPQVTGLNPFRLSSQAPNSQVFPQQQQSLQPQFTAGGLERLPTVPVFPETQQAAILEQAQMKARHELEQSMLQQRQQQQMQQKQQQLQQQQANQQQYHQQQQMMQQQALNQQATGWGFQQQPTGAFQQQPQFQQTGLLQQAQPQTTGGFYSGPSLI
ncbi:hypothetical protein BABINDRAFT_166362 [Babjeviella inositovora NRRL Y-12698]|uniref:ENTH domain-containing protein n=1 Tax=Babjeviella inositovora NRRL Y-12698 TaxID=984486 RepID=A0A1E3QT12_9ASCO|nr:uncharacterized protein BABINDRAFT_166362 [Babjeviella inositovora NRRL Y-12698]ODQ80778.1 hypothetical protein BABINDRAFT_166362 [Babjeviella inositovora NRRL Y-12698]